METKQYFSKLDFDPTEIDDLLDNILLDYPDLILDLLRKSSGKRNKFPKVLNSHEIETQPTVVANEIEKSIFLEEVTNCESAPCDEVSSVETNNIEDILPVDEFEIPTITIKTEFLKTEELNFQCVGPIQTHLRDYDALSYKQNVDFEIKPETCITNKACKQIKNVDLTESYLNKRAGCEIFENKNAESTKTLLRELEEELERLTCAVNETSLIPVNTGPKQSLEYSSSFDHFSQHSKKNEIRRRGQQLEDPFHKRHSSKERPHSAFEQASLGGGNSGQQLSKYSQNFVEDGNDQEMARCFNLKGTFSLGRYSQKKNKKESIVGQRELPRNASEHLFKEFKNWQPLHKHLNKKDKKKTKHFSSHNLRESSADSERSSMMLEELNTVLDRHLDDNIYFGDKFKNMPEMWSNDNKVPSWCKLHMSRHEAVSYLRDKPIRSFVVRNSNSYKGAYGLVLKVSEGYRDPRKGDFEGHVKNFLIESLPSGVKVKGSPIEPIFPDLPSLIREHCRNQISLPCKLLSQDPIDINLLEESEGEHDDSPLNLSKDALDSNETLVRINLNCNVLYLSSERVESLNETAAVRKATQSMYSSTSHKYKKTTICQLRISGSGLTLTDTCRSLFFRRFYPRSIILYSGINADDQRWAWTDEATKRTNTSRIFGVVTRKNDCASTENTCHLFAELDHSADEIISAIMRLVADYTQN